MSSGPLPPGAVGTDTAGSLEAAPSAAPSQESAVAPPPKPKATTDSELLCTICGLRSCWQPPANAKGAAPPA